MEGVESVTTDFDNKTATVTMKEGHSLTPEACNKAFEGTKYKALKVEAATTPTS